MACLALGRQSQLPQMQCCHSWLSQLVRPRASPCHKPVQCWKGDRLGFSWRFQGLFSTWSTVWTAAEAGLPAPAAQARIMPFTCAVPTTATMLLTAGWPFIWPSPSPMGQLPSGAPSGTTSLHTWRCPTLSRTYVGAAPAPGHMQEIQSATIGAQSHCTLGFPFSVFEMKEEQAAPGFPKRDKDNLPRRLALEGTVRWGTALSP